MVPTTLDLLRHGECEGGPRYRGSSDDVLTPAGWRQMWAAVGDAHWDHIITSPLCRCADFARDLGARRHIPLTVEPRLREMDFGAWEGKSAAELMESDGEALARFWRDPASHPPPGGEPLGQFRERVLGAWRSLVTASPSGQFLIVSHGGPIRIILSEVMKLSAPRLLEIEVGYGTLRKIRIGDDGHPLVEEDSR